MSTPMYAIRSQGTHVLIVIGVFIACLSVAASGAPVADFTFEGMVSSGNPFRVNEEIFFDASSTQFDDGTTPDFTNRRGFTWDFGDGITSGQDYGGISMVHVYTRPGTYPVTLTVLDSNGNSSVITKSVTIEGYPPKLPPRAEARARALELNFDNDDLNDSSPQAHEVVWLGNNPPRYIRSSITGGKCIDLADGYIRIPSNPALNGFSEGFTCSIWLKRKSPRDGGTLLHKDGLLSIRTWTSGKQNPVGASVRNAAGSATHCQNWSFTGDAEWHNIVVIYDAQTAKVALYTDGVLQQSADGQAVRDLAGALATSAGDLFIGAKPDGSEHWNGYVDEIKIFNRALTTEEALRGFESEHADFHCRIAQFIDYHIPTDVRTDPTNRLRITLTGTDYSKVLHQKTDLQPVERILFDLSKLPANKYTLTAQLLDITGRELDRYEEFFSKPYPGVPRVGINQFNAICIDGEPFFPVTSFALNNADIDNWKTDAAYPLINTLHSQGNWPTDYTPDGWEVYLNLANTNGLVAVGPGQWRDVNPYGRNYGARYAKTSTIIEYVTRLKDHNSVLAWAWKDEPDLGGPTEAVPAPTVRSWTFLSHKHDPQHPVATNLCGPAWVVHETSKFRDRYTYQGTRNTFGRKTNIADIMSLDYYPFDWRLSRQGQNATVAGLVEGIRRFQAENPYVPTTFFIETADIRDDAIVFHKDWNRGYYSDLTPTVTPAQIKMLAWLHVVLGAKGVNWFAYFRDFEPYLQGRANLVAGSTTVTGNASVRWEPIFEGRTFTAGGVTAIIKSVPLAPGATYAQTLELAAPWAGPTRTDAIYTIGANLRNMNAMADFCKQITELTPIVLGPPTSRTVTVTPRQGIIRTMVREHNGAIYLIAVRQTEYGETISDPSVAFELAGLNGRTVKVYREKREIASTGDRFTDQFGPNDVHIYVIGGSLATKSPSDDLSEVLIADWKFDEYSGTAAGDSVEDNAAATLTNGPLWTGYGQLRLDGVNDSVDCGADGHLNQKSSLTLCAWIRPETFGLRGDARIVDKGNESAGFAFYLKGGIRGLAWKAGNAEVTSAEDAIRLNEWQHVAVSYSDASDTVTFYVNGKAKGTVTGYTTNPADSADVPLIIGNNAALAAGFKGMISDVRLYSRALTAEEIDLIYRTYEVRENKLVAFEVAADGYTYALQAGQTLPAGATFADGVFSWRPWYNQAGNYTFHFDVAGQAGLTQSIPVVVENVILNDWYRIWLDLLGK